jgi:hypothetical protein
LLRIKHSIKHQYPKTIFCSKNIKIFFLPHISPSPNNQDHGPIIFYYFSFAFTQYYASIYAAVCSNSFSDARFIIGYAISDCSVSYHSLHPVFSVMSALITHYPFTTYSIYSSLSISFTSNTIHFINTSFSYPLVIALTRVSNPTQPFFSNRSRSASSQTLKSISFQTYF